MAEDESRRDGSKRSSRRDAARGGRREPQVIEGEARALSDQPASLEPGATESEVVDSHPVPIGSFVAPESIPDLGQEAVSTEDPRSSTASDRVDAPNEELAPHHSGRPIEADHQNASVTADSPRSGWTSAIVLAFVVLAAGVLYLFYQVSSLPPDTSATVADLKARIATLEGRPATDAAGLADRVASAERAAGNTQAAVATLGKRVDDLTAKAGETSGAIGRLSALERSVADLKGGLATVQASLAALPRPDIGRIESRIADVDQRVSALQSTVGGIPHIDLGPLTAKVDAVDARLAPIEADVASSRAPEQVAQRKAAPVAVTAQAIAGAIEADQAFPKELQALQVLGVDPAKLASLQVVADRGAPSLHDLQTELADGRDRILTRSAQRSTGTYVGRLMQGASSLVQVRPLGSTVSDSPAAIVARMSDAIGADDLVTALNDWGKLPETAQAVTKPIADRIKLRLDAEQAAKAIAADAIAAMAPRHG